MNGWNDNYTVVDREKYLCFIIFIKWMKIYQNKNVYGIFIGLTFVYKKKCVQAFII